MSLLFSSLVSLGSAAWVWWFAQNASSDTALLFVLVGAILNAIAGSTVKTKRDRFNFVCCSAAYMLAVCFTGYVLA